MNRFSLNTFNESPWVGGSADLGGWIDAAASAGFGLIGPDCPSIDAWLAGGGTLPALARRMRDAGIGCEVVAVCALIDGSEAQLAGLQRAVTFAGALGARMLQVNVAAPDAPARLDAVAKAASLLDDTGLKLALEYMPFTSLSTLAETLEIVAVLGTARAGALVDIWHHANDPGGWEALAAAPLDAIAYVEFDDAKAPGQGVDLADETMHHRTFPGEGVLDCARFAGALRARLCGNGQYRSARPRVARQAGGRIRPRLPRSVRTLLGVNARHRTLADFTGGGDWEAMVAKRDAPVPMESNRSG